ncbi:MAG: hypothetical protein RIC35_09640 [Marinoscillum sp.]
MKKASLNFSVLLLIASLITSCGSKKNTSESESTDSTEVETKKYQVYKAPASKDYPDAALSMSAPSGGEIVAGETTFTFRVDNYELGVQTPDAAGRGIANSGKGQHIHFILNNDPYSAHYEPEFKKELTEGKHIVLAFLSRSYHESVKNGNAFILKELTVGTPDSTESFDSTAQHLFYSRPKGTYSGADTEKLMLDFFLYNTSISPNGNKVRATINGEEHMITEWAPYYIEGLGKGEVTVQLELIDAAGNVIPGPFNTVTRKVTLE